MSEPRVQRVSFTNTISGVEHKVSIRRNRTYAETEAQLGRISEMLHNGVGLDLQRSSRIARVFADTVNAMGIQGRIEGYNPSQRFVLNRKNNRV